MIHSQRQSMLSAESEELPPTPKVASLEQTTNKSGFTDADALTAGNRPVVCARGMGERRGWPLALGGWR
jgi:hypothetical protein